MLVVEKGVESPLIWEEETSYLLLERDPAEASPESGQGVLTSDCLFQSLPQILGVKI